MGSLCAGTIWLNSWEFEEIYHCTRFIFINLLCVHIGEIFEWFVFKFVLRVVLKLGSTQ